MEIRFISQKKLLQRNEAVWNRNNKQRYVFISAILTLQEIIFLFIFLFLGNSRENVTKQYTFFYWNTFLSINIWRSLNSLGIYIGAQSILVVLKLVTWTFLGWDPIIIVKVLQCTLLETRIFQKNEQELATLLIGVVCKYQDWA